MIIKLALFIFVIIYTCGLYHIIYGQNVLPYLQFNETDIFRLRFDSFGEYIYGFFMWSQQTNHIKSR